VSIVSHRAAAARAFDAVSLTASVDRTLPAFAQVS